MYEKQDTILFLDPGFPVHKQQLKVLGQKFETFDVYDFRGDKLKAKIESYLSKGNIAALLYSNPNNPSWICFTEKELKIIAELADKYNVVVLEDLAYVAMDFRKDLYHPGKLHTRQLLQDILIITFSSFQVPKHLAMQDSDWIDDYVK